MAKHKSYTTSVSLSDVTRNKLIALANTEEITQKELLNKLIDKEIDQLNFKSKGIYAYILKVIEIKDEFRNKKEK